MIIPETLHMLDGIDVISSSIVITYLKTQALTQNTHHPHVTLNSHTSLQYLLLTNVFTHVSNSNPHLLTTLCLPYSAPTPRISRSTRPGAATNSNLERRQRYHKLKNKFHTFTWQYGRNSERRSTCRNVGLTAVGCSWPRLQTRPRQVSSDLISPGQAFLVG